MIVAVTTLGDAAQTAGVIVAALLGAAALLARAPRARAAAMLGALVLTPVLLVANIWSTPQFEPLRDRAALALAAGVGGLVVLGSGRCDPPPARAARARRCRDAAVPDPDRVRRRHGEPARAAVRGHRARACWPTRCRACARRTAWRTSSARTIARCATSAACWSGCWPARSSSTRCRRRTPATSTARCSRRSSSTSRSRCCTRCSCASAGRRSWRAAASSCWSCSRRCSSRIGFGSTASASCCSTRRSSAPTSSSPTSASTRCSSTRTSTGASSSSVMLGIVALLLWSRSTRARRWPAWPRSSLLWAGLVLTLSQSSFTALLVGPGGARRAAVGLRRAAAVGGGVRGGRRRGRARGARRGRASTSPPTRRRAGARSS